MAAAPEKSKESVPPRTKWGKALRLAKDGFFTFVIPTSLKRFALFALCWGLLQPMAGRLFPRAEDVVKKEGLDPAIVQTLAPGKKIYVRQGESLPARAHALLDAGAPFAPLHYWTQMRASNSVAAYTISDATNSVFRLPLKLAPESERPCIIYMKPKAALMDARDLRRVVERKAGRAIDWKDPLTLTRDELYRLDLLHEIRHCSDANQRLEEGYEKESDATWAGLSALAAARKQPGLIDAFQRESGVGVGGAYDIALYIDAKRKGMAPPTGADVEKIAAEVEPLETPLLKKKASEAAGDCGPVNPKAACRFKPPAFSGPLARRRYQLTEQFISHVLDVAPKKAPPRKPGSRKPTA